MSSDRRPLWQPFSDPATDTTVRPSSAARLLAVEWAPFLQPAADAAEAPASRRLLGHGGLAETAVLDDQH
ncbi:hypothetical protein ACWDRR_25830 [Kitasatospora sp. NPDC003701]